jgi:TatD DNase family protein
MWIDTHAHLYDLDEQSLAVSINSCDSAGVSLVVNTGTSLVSSREVLKQCSKHKSLFAAVGISPFDVASLPDSWEKELEELIGDTRVIAVGETGIDSTNPSYPDIRLQVPVFKTHCALARSCDLPIVIHSRGSELKAVDICIDRGVVKALFHCYTGDIIALKKILDAGYYISFSGIITFNNTSLRSLVEYTPIDRILIETDSPYLAPVPFRGKKNQPVWVANVGRKVAEIKKMEEEETARVLMDNFKRLFNDSYPLKSYLP